MKLIDPTARREQTEDAIVLGLLDAVEVNSKVTQRHLAQELGIALGLTNAYLRRCVRKGYLKVSEVPARRYAYYLTPRGFAEKSRLTAEYLSASFDFMRRARGELADIFARGVSRGAPCFLLIGLGDLADIAGLVATCVQAEIVEVLPAEHEVDRLRNAALPYHFDNVMVTATEKPQEVFAAAIAAFGVERVSAPKLLRVRLGNANEGSAP